MGSRRGVSTDRVAGVLLGMACGDALGAGYEFGPALAPGTAVGMVGGGVFNWAPGEWTDDTSMAIAIAEVAATGADLGDRAAQDQIVSRWAAWAHDAPDVGAQTRAVIGAALAAAAGSPAAVSAADFAAAAARHHQRAGRSGGNGSLMRTAPVALAYLGPGQGPVLAGVAAELSALTHHDPEAAEACALWCLAIRHAVRHGTLDGLRAALTRLPADRAAVWADRLDVAERTDPAAYRNNGWVVEALQAAWSAIARTRPADRDPGHLVAALEAAVRGGGDTDTVAAIVGGLVGAAYGASAIPSRWRRVLHGWPGLRAEGLVRLAVLTANAGRPDAAGWPAGDRVDYRGFPLRRALARHPHDPGVWIGGSAVLDELPAGVDAVVSLCRLGAAQVPAAGVAAADHVQVWLLDSPDPDDNPNLRFVVADAAAAVRRLREEGKTVYLHCVEARSRTPTVAAVYGATMTGRPVGECLDAVLAVLPGADPNPAFRALLADWD